MVIKSKDEHVLIGTIIAFDVGFVVKRDKRFVKGW